MVNISEFTFNPISNPIILEFNPPIIDDNNYTVIINDMFVSTTIINQTITIPYDSSFTDYFVVSFFAMDLSGYPIFVSFDLYFGKIDMPVRVRFSNGTPAVNISIIGSLTDNPLVTQSGFTDADGRFLFKNLPPRTISVQATTNDNQLGFLGVGASTIEQNIVLSSSVTNNSSKMSPIKKKFIETSRAVLNLWYPKAPSARLSIPGFNITTEGQGLAQTTRSFLNNDNSTKITVRYQFITSEVPGGFFGSRYNDYFTVSIRSVSGGLVSASQSMNALGLGAFTFSTGATDLFTLSLTVSGIEESVTVSVGVANVGDGAFPSTVVVDSISSETCDTCGDCQECKSDPMCETNCQNPPLRSCFFYTNCMENKVPCGQSGYAIGYGSKFCNKFVRNINFFSSSGQTWMYATMNCLQKALVSPLQQCDKTCSELRTLAFDSHPSCYVTSGVGICNLPYSDWFGVVRVVGSELFTDEGFLQVLKTVPSCIPMLIEDFGLALLLPSISIPQRIFLLILIAWLNELNRA